MSQATFHFGDYEYALARDASIQANAAASDARRARSEAEGLTQRLERLALMTEALWTLLRDRLGVSEDELLQVAQAIDLSDGRLDGRAHRASAACPACQRMVAKRHARCLYCGEPMKRTPFTDV